MALIEHKKPQITVFTDASVLHLKKKAGWGGWSRGDGRPSVFHKGKAPFSKNIGLVETFAMRQMIRKLLATGYLTSEDTHISIQSDSLAFLQLMATYPKTHVSNRGQGANIKKIVNSGGPMSDYCQEIHQDLSFTRVIYLKHVKAHQCSSTGGRQWVNNKCDRMAKEAANSESG